MEATTFFALFIGAIAVIHFLSLIDERVRSVKRKRKVRAIRKNWYCFFSPNVLLGQNNREESANQNDQQDLVRKRKLRRQQEQLRLRLKTPERVFISMKNLD